LWALQVLVLKPGVFRFEESCTWDNLRHIHFIGLELYLVRGIFIVFYKVG
jgi:hypothetical protein